MRPHGPRIHTQHDRLNKMIRIYDRKGFTVILSLDADSLVDAVLNQADLQNANLVEADLGNAHLREANLRGADLRLTSLVNADLRNADLTDADLSGADLSHALLDGACFTNARLEQTRLPGDFVPDTDKKPDQIAIPISDIRRDKP